MSKTSALRLALRQVMLAPKGEGESWRSALLAHTPPGRGSFYKIDELIPSPPSGIAENDWQEIARSADSGNKRLAARMANPDEPQRVYEFGGIANADDPIDLVTSFDPFAVKGMRLPRAAGKGTLLVHSHPHLAPLEGSPDIVSPTPLSAQDMIALGSLNAITSLDPTGSMGYAVRHKGAPYGSLPWSDLWNETKEAAKKAAPPATSPTFRLPGAGASNSSALDPDNFELYEAVASPALGLALKRAGLLERYGYATTDPRQERAWKEVLRQPTRKATEAALSVLRNHLGVPKWKALMLAIGGYSGLRAALREYQGAQQNG